MHASRPKPPPVLPTPVAPYASVNLVTVIAAAVLFAATAVANPMPESAVYVHVRPVQVDFCTSNTITTCSQIAQYTYDTGELEFDLFLWTPFPRPLYACDLQLTWPTGWQYRGMEVCGDGAGWINGGSGGGALHAEWSWGPMMENEVFLAARVALAVDGYGRFSTEGGTGTVTWGDPPETVPIDWLLTATAGVTCAYCYHSCPGGGICAPSLDPNELLFELPPGGTGEQMLEAGVYPPGGPTPGFGATESWISLRVEHPGPWPDYWQVFVTADASGLPPGDHLGWVTATCGCRDCTLVTLRVLEGTGVAAHTWGRLKALYRDATR